MTKAEKAWLDAITQLGCIVCLLESHPGTPGCPHHMLDGGRRRGHLFTICLCDPGHHQNGGEKKISRHPDKARFEAAYGTEESLLAKSRVLVAAHRAAALGRSLAQPDDLPHGFHNGYTMKSGL